MTTAKKKIDDPILTVASPAKWDEWLKKHHTTSLGVWLRCAKIGAAKSITYVEALDIGLAWGWIDSQKRGLDESAFLQRFTRRTAKSPWSKINVAKAEALINAGKMQPSGLREVLSAKSDGRWERAYDGARTATVPQDLMDALAKEPKAKTFFEGLDGANRYAIWYRVHSAKTATTRAKWIERLVAMCAKGETIHPVRERVKKAAAKTAKTAKTAKSKA